MARHSKLPRKSLDRRRARVRTCAALASAHASCGPDARVAYDNGAKVKLLGVPTALIDEHGAVSEPVAIAMAEGVRGRTGADVAVSITGIAGPGGGSEQKPVGTVVIAVSVPAQPTFVRTYSFIGGRAQVKFQSTQAALDRVRRMLM